MSAQAFDVEVTCSTAWTAIITQLTTTTATATEATHVLHPLANALPCCPEAPARS
jgi:hypothetical protein